MTRFNSVEEIRLEKQRLYLKKESLEDEIRLEFHEIRESLKPSHIIRDLFTPGKNGHSNHQADSQVSGNGLTGTVGSTFVDMLVTGLFLKKSSYLKKFVSSYLIRLVTPGIISKAGPGLLNLIKSGLEDIFKKRKQQHVYDPTYIADDY